MKAIPDTGSLVVFDGVCVLCNNAVRFILKFESKSDFYFTTFQSEAFREYALRHNLQLRSDSVVLIEGGRVFLQSDAALCIAHKLRYWSVLYYLFSWWPAFVRDGVYRFIAHRRYRWFGTQATCMVPAPQHRHRFFT
jgi:predicted DCC family thiol-disulfide oxidoreductase YuxK